MTAIRITRAAAFALLVAVVASPAAFAWDYSSPVWAYNCKTTADGQRICAYSSTNLLYGQGWNLYSYDYVNGTHYAWSSACPSWDPSKSNWGISMTGTWSFSGLGVGVDAGTGGIGVSLSVVGTDVKFEAVVPPGGPCNYIRHNFGGPHPTGWVFYRSENVFGNMSYRGQLYSTNAWADDWL